MTYECNDNLARLLNALRSNQRAYFAAKHGTPEKQAALVASKQCEKLLDDFLKARAEQANQAPDLFS